MEKPIKMQPSTRNIAPAEKAVSVLSYFTMGIAGLIWILIAYFLNKRLKFFLMYNAVQSMLISVFLALLNIVLTIILQIITVIPALNRIGINISIFLQQRFNLLGLSFNITEIFVFIVLLYISTGIILGKIFYVPCLTRIMKKIMKEYR